MHARQDEASIKYALNGKTMGIGKHVRGNLLNQNKTTQNWEILFGFWYGVAKIFE